MCVYRLQCVPILFECGCVCDDNSIRFLSIYTSMLIIILCSVVCCCMVCIVCTGGGSSTDQRGAAAGVGGERGAEDGLSARAFAGAAAAADQVRRGVLPLICPYIYLSDRHFIASFIYSVVVCCAVLPQRHGLRGSSLSATLREARRAHRRRCPQARPSPLSLSHKIYPGCPCHIYGASKRNMLKLVRVVAGAPQRPSSVVSAWHYPAQEAQPVRTFLYTHARTHTTRALRAVHAE